ncbi:hypothetical protein AMECASPLE_024470 [Ameca splendens]|uniref:Uncharacterized protein n=1 Tax=Ameca splendens TaxID=208324 RepID=A0ABV0YRZ6_9TELE
MGSFDVPCLTVNDNSIGYREEEGGFSLVSGFEGLGKENKDAGIVILLPKVCFLGRVWITLHTEGRRCQSDYMTATILKETIQSSACDLKHMKAGEQSKPQQ